MPSLKKSANKVNIKLKNYFMSLISPKKYITQKSNHCNELFGNPSEFFFICQSKWKQTKQTQLNIQNILYFTDDSKFK